MSREMNIRSRDLGVGQALRDELDDPHLSRGERGPAGGRARARPARAPGPFERLVDRQRGGVADSLLQRFPVLGLGDDAGDARVASGARGGGEQPGGVVVRAESGGDLAERVQAPRHPRQMTALGAGVEVGERVLPARPASRRVRRRDGRA